jgi:hypothetical protein
MEDAVSEAVIQRVLRESRQKYATATIYNRGGNGYLQRVIGGFNNAAKGTPFLVLTDLDKYQCPATLMADWLNVPKHPNLLLRVAVTEVEAWLLADRQGIAAFLGVKPDLVPLSIEQLPNPKQTLVNLACTSRKREIKKDICPGENSTRKVGPNYNPQLVAFVERKWDLVAARANSESLNRLIDRLENFQPTYNRPSAQH